MNRSFANGNGPTGGNSGIGTTAPFIPWVDDGTAPGDRTHWWFWL